MTVSYFRASDVGLVRIEDGVATAFDGATSWEVSTPEITGDTRAAKLDITEEAFLGLVEEMRLARDAFFASTSSTTGPQEPSS